MHALLKASSLFRTSGKCPIRLSKSFGPDCLPASLRTAFAPLSPIRVLTPSDIFCRREWQELKKVPDKVKVYIFLIPFRGHEENRAKADYIACSRDPIKALDEVFSGKFDGKPPKVPRCPLVDEHIRLAESLNVGGTPYNIILKDYKVIEGYNPELLKIMGVRK
jgi:thiol:disulfide interchange protein DsbC